MQRARGTDGFLDRPFHVRIRHQRKAVTEMFAHRLHPRDVGCEGRAAHLHLDCAKALGEIFVGLPQKCFDREIKVDTQESVGGQFIGSITGEQAVPLTFY